MKMDVDWITYTLQLLFVFT